MPRTCWASSVWSFSDPFEVGGLLLQERANVNARCGPGAPECEDVLHLGEGETEAATNVSS